MPKKQFILEEIIRKVREGTFSFDNKKIQKGFYD